MEHDGDAEYLLSVPKCEVPTMETNVKEEEYHSEHNGSLHVEDSESQNGKQTKMELDEHLPPDPGSPANDAEMNGNDEPEADGERDGEMDANGDPLKKLKNLKFQPMVRRPQLNKPAEPAARREPTPPDEPAAPPKNEPRDPSPVSEDEEEGEDKSEVKEQRVTTTTNTVERKPTVFNDRPRKRRYDGDDEEDRDRRDRRRDERREREREREPKPDVIQARPHTFAKRIDSLFREEVRTGTLDDAQLINLIAKCCELEAEQNLILENRAKLMDELYKMKLDEEGRIMRGIEQHPDSMKHLAAAQYEDFKKRFSMMKPVMGPGGVLAFPPPLIGNMGPGPLPQPTAQPTPAPMPARPPFIPNPDFSQPPPNVGPSVAAPPPPIPDFSKPPPDFSQPPPSLAPPRVPAAPKTPPPPLQTTPSTQPVASASNELPDTSQPPPSFGTPTKNSSLAESNPWKMDDKEMTPQSEPAAGNDFGAPKSLMGPPIPAPAVPAPPSMNIANMLTNMIASSIRMTHPPNQMHMSSSPSKSSPAFEHPEAQPLPRRLKRGHRAGKKTAQNRERALSHFEAIDASAAAERSPLEF
ncbi:unnamed protein product, partial [Mesorhabditis spiculigera]